MPSAYVAPAYTAESKSRALSRRKVCSASWSIFRIMAAAESTFLNGFAAVGRNQTTAKGDSTTFVVRR
jgi:hypothetical protein